VSLEPVVEFNQVHSVSKQRKLTSSPARW